MLSIEERRAYDSPVMSLAERRDASAALGLVHYDGAPCKHGHGTRRYVNTNHCVECNRAKSLKSERRARNRRFALKIKAWLKNDPDAMKLLYDILEAS